MKRATPSSPRLIDDAILAARKSGKMYELQEKWFGTSVQGHG